MNNAPTITELKADGTDVQDSIWNETSVFPPSGLIQKIEDMADPFKLKPTWVQLESLDQATRLSVVAQDPNGDDLEYSWTVNGKKAQTGKNKDTVALDLGRMTRVMR